VKFTNRDTPPTDEDFACPPGIRPGRRLPDHCYMDDDAAQKLIAARASLAMKPQSSPETIRKQIAGMNKTRQDLQVKLFDF
jgi:hypothetical protein